MGTPGGGVAHRGRLIEGNADAALLRPTRRAARHKQEHARGVSDGLHGLFVEAVVPQAVTGRVAGGLRWAREHARPSRPTGERGRGPCGAQWRAASRGCGNGEGSVRVRLRVWESYAGQSKECVPERERVRLLTRRVGGGMQGKGGKLFAFASAGADTKANTWGLAAHPNEVTELPLSPSHSAMMPSVVATKLPLS